MTKPLSNLVFEITLVGDNDDEISSRLVASFFYDDEADEYCERLNEIQSDRTTHYVWFHRVVV